MGWTPRLMNPSVLTIRQSRLYQRLAAETSSASRLTPSNNAPPRRPANHLAGPDLTNASLPFSLPPVAYFLIMPLSR